MNLHSAISFAVGLFFGAALGLALVIYHHDRAQLYIMAEVKRQCESPWPLLLDNKFYRCYPTGEVLK